MQRTTAYSYDRRGRKTAITSGSDSTLYSYNYLGKIEDVNYPDGNMISYGYDMEGNVTSRTVTENSQSVITNYKHDALGRVSYKQYSNDPNWADPNNTLPFDEFLYDAAGNKSIVAYINDSNDMELGLYSYNGLGNLTGSAESYSDFGYGVNYGYDQRGLLTSVYYPDQKTVSLTRDALGRIETISYDGSNIIDYYYLGDTVIKKIIDNIGYTAVVDSLGRITAESYNSLDFNYNYLTHTTRLTGRDSTVYGYDTLGRVTSEDAASYTCDILGNPTNAVEDNLIYTLDNEDRVTDVNDGSGIIASYSYDRFGRRTSKTAGGITTYFAYDKFGNVIAEYQDSGSGVVWQHDYIYGANGELVYMQLPLTAATNTALDNLISFCQAWLCNPNCDSNDLYWDDNNDVQINFIDWAAADMNNFVGAFAVNGRYILTDFKNSVIGIADENNIIEISYNAWGQPSYTGDIVGLSILWNGYYYDAETSNYYLRNRYYSPLERRFITEDPRGINPDGNWNNRFNVLGQYGDGFGLKVYAAGDPVNGWDGWGLKQKKCCRCFCVTGLSIKNIRYIPAQAPPTYSGSRVVGVKFEVWATGYWSKSNVKRKKLPKYKWWEKYSHSPISGPGKGKKTNKWNMLKSKTINAPEADCDKEVNTLVKDDTSRAGIAKGEVKQKINFVIRVHNPKGCRCGKGSVAIRATQQYFGYQRTVKVNKFTVGSWR